MSVRRTVVLGLAGLLTLAVGIGAAYAQGDLKVVVTSKPVHSLVAEVMKGVGTPALLVDGAASPHTYAMRPSDAQLVNRADVLFRVSAALEPFTVKVVRSLPRSVKVVTLADAPGMKLLQRRAGGPFEVDRHAHGHGGPGTKTATTSSARHRDHAHGSVEAYDAHVWLDPDNAKAMVSSIAAVLGERAPGEAARFNANAADVNRRIDVLAAALAADLAAVAGRPFVVLHDAYQYFERRFGLTAIGSIVVDPDEQPSAKRISDLRRKVGALSAVCVFAEPHHQPRVVGSVTEGTTARTAVLDPEGTTLAAGPELYFELMQRLAGAVKGCLTTTT